MDGRGAFGRVGDNTVYEFACHEANYEVLKGVDAGRADDK